MTAGIVEARELYKCYGPKVAVDHVSFAVKEGEVFGILGPNGAGKTTTLEMIEGIRVPDGGTAFVDGLEVRSNRREVQQRIGVQLQATTLFDRLRVEETLKLFASLFPRSMPLHKLIQDFHLEEVRRDFASNLSGGQRQRLSLALALVNDPRVLFLDEPTTGLDPQARRAVWEMVERLRGEGKTIVLTTHYMEEAEVLCDRVAIMDEARIIALDTPQALINGLQVEKAIECRLSEEITVGELERLPGIKRVSQSSDGFLLYCDHLETSMFALLRLAEERKANLEDLRIHSATLEDVFLSLTGKLLRD
jgi:ABC-2 type transport system ATP-binding protein